MTHPSTPARISNLKALSKGMAGIVVLVGVAVMAGWIYDTQILKSILPVWASMKVNTALCIIASGVALWLLQDARAGRAMPRACAWAVVAIGAMTLGEYVFGWDLGIDELLFKDAPISAATTRPGRMAPNTAICFLLIGGALLLLDRETARGRRPAQALALASSLVAMLSLIGYAYGAEYVTPFTRYAKMGAHTAFCFALLSGGILFARPDRGVMAVFVSDSIGGSMARWLLPAAAAMMVVLGWLRIAGEHAGYYKSEFGLSMLTSASITILGALIWRSARSIDRADAKRRIAEESLRKARDELEVRVQQRTADIANQNREMLLAAKSLATFADEIVGATTELATTAIETAAEVRETTATVEEVKHASQISSEQAQVVSEQAQKAAESSRSGTRAVGETIEGMKDIREQMGVVSGSIMNLSEQSQLIGVIISTVEDLAAQSKILAVNASIEAAKAGDEGRGFTVVAQEVRSLSQQSRKATAQVRGILNDIQKAMASAVLATEQAGKTVDAGVVQSTAASEAIKALGAGVAESVKAAAQIAATSQQQFVGMDQVAAAMESIKLASLHAVTSTQQAEDATHQLHELGQKLKQLAEHSNM